MATYKATLEKFVRKEQWHQIDKVYLSFADNMFLKISTLNTKEFYRSYYFNVALENHQKLKFKIKYNQIEQLKKDIDQINYLLKYVLKARRIE